MNWMLLKGRILLERQRMLIEEQRVCDSFLYSREMHAQMAEEELRKKSMAAEERRQRKR
jgi:hypothetical protein